MAHGCTPNEPKNPLATTWKSMALDISKISTPSGGTVDIFRWILIRLIRIFTGRITRATTSKNITMATYEYVVNVESAM